ncbi:MAG: response regulator transcription factor [Chloroflexota bacterium]
MEQIRVIIADDHAVVRQGLAAMLTPRYGMNVVGEAATGLEAVRQASKLKPDVVIMDLNMPGMDGIEATAAIKTNDPQIRVLVLSSFNEEDMAHAIMDAGASGYLLKESSADELIQAIRSVYSGHLILSPSVMQTLSSKESNRRDGYPAQVDLTPANMRCCRVL